MVLFCIGDMDLQSLLCIHVQMDSGHDIKYDTCAKHFPAISDCNHMVRVLPSAVILTPFPISDEMVAAAKIPAVDVMGLNPEGILNLFTPLAPAKISTSM